MQIVSCEQEHLSELLPASPPFSGSQFITLKLRIVFSDHEVRVMGSGQTGASSEGTEELTAGL